jgi:hypothetical protein
VVSWIGAPDPAALGCLCWRVDLATPPTGPDGAGRPESDGRPPRRAPRVLERRVLRMSSRLVSSLEDMLMAE